MDYDTDCRIQWCHIRVIHIHRTSACLNSRWFRCQYRERKNGTVNISRLYIIVYMYCFTNMKSITF